MENLSGRTGIRTSKGTGARATLLMENYKEKASKLMTSKAGWPSATLLEESQEALIPA